MTRPRFGLAIVGLGASLAPLDIAVNVALPAITGHFRGGLVELWGWPAVYWVRVPIALVTLALSGLLPSPKLDQRPFDAMGAVLLAACMSMLLLSLVLSQRTEVLAVWPALLLAAALVLV